MEYRLAEHTAWARYGLVVSESQAQSLPFYERFALEKLGDTVTFNYEVTVHNKHRNFTQRYLFDEIDEVNDLLQVATQSNGIILHAPISSETHILSGNYSITIKPTR